LDFLLLSSNFIIELLLLLLLFINHFVFKHSLVGWFLDFQQATIGLL
jgi:hypothetical protein